MRLSWLLLPFSRVVLVQWKWSSLCVHVFLLPFVCYYFICMSHVEGYLHTHKTLLTFCCNGKHGYETFVKQLQQFFLEHITVAFSAHRMHHLLLLYVILQTSVSECMPLWEECCFVQTLLSISLWLILRQHMQFWTASKPNLALIESLSCETRACIQNGMINDWQTMSYGYKHFAAVTLCWLQERQPCIAVKWGCIIDDYLCS